MTDHGGPSFIPPPGYDEPLRIGRGGFSVVYRARQVALDRLVAIKVLLTDLSDPADARRFDIECRTLGRLGAHPHIIDVHDAGVSVDGRPYLIMRYYAGGTLADRLKRTGPLPADQVVQLGVLLAEALQAAHDIGVVHRDIKPENVLVNEQGQPILSDFGVAAVADAMGRYTTSVAFSRSHVAPEVLEHNEYGIPSDVFSLGSTLYSLVEGRSPFEADSDVQRAMSMAANPVPPPLSAQDVPDGLYDVLVACMERSSLARIGSAREVATALSALAVGSRPLPPIWLAPSPSRLTQEVGDSGRATPRSTPADDDGDDDRSGEANETRLRLVTEDRPDSPGPPPPPRPSTPPPPPPSPPPPGSEEPEPVPARSATRRAVLLGSAVVVLGGGAAGGGLYVRSRGEAPGPDPDRPGAAKVEATYPAARTYPGFVAAFGSNRNGELGRGDVTQYPGPVALPDLEPGCQFALRGEWSMALRPTGQVLTWGSNDSGQLGNGTAEAGLEPRPVPGLVRIRKIAAGVSHAFALAADGTVWAWGSNDAGQLGLDLDGAAAPAPVRVPGLDGVVDIVAGAKHSLARRSDGAVLSWGFGGHGERGQGPSELKPRQSTPTVISGLTGVVRLWAGWKTSAAADANGTVWVWGKVSEGGLPATGDRLTSPTQSSALTDARSLALGQEHGLLLRQDGTVHTWGKNAHGQLGDGTRTDRPVPGPVPGLAGVVAIASGSRHCVALTADGALYAWGSNEFGQTGIPGRGDVLTPTRVSGVGPIAAVFAGQNHCLTRPRGPATAV